MSRESFLARVKQAAELGRAYRIDHQTFAPEIGYVGVAGDPCEHLANEINAVGGVATLVDSLDQARAELSGYLTETAAQAALCWQHPLLDRLGLATLLAERNVTQINHNQARELDVSARRLQQLGCEIGITSVDLAIAETGTLFVCSRPGQERVASLVPPMHVAIVERSQIVPDLLDAFRILHERGLENLPSNITLITGPSKTGDIELQLTTGVHGPGKWRVIIIRA